MQELNGKKCSHPEQHIINSKDSKLSPKKKLEVRFTNHFDKEARMSATGTILMLICAVKGFHETIF